MTADCAGPAFVPLWALGLRTAERWERGSMIHHPPEPCSYPGCGSVIVASTRETRPQPRASRGPRVYCSAAHKATAAAALSAPGGPAYTPPLVRVKGPAHTPPTQPADDEAVVECPTPRKLAFPDVDEAAEYFTELLDADPTLQLYRCGCGSWHAGHRGPKNRVTPTSRPPMTGKLGAIAHVTLTRETFEKIGRAAQEAADVAEVLHVLTEPNPPAQENPVPNPMIYFTAPDAISSSVHATLAGKNPRVDVQLLAGHRLASAAVDIASLPVDDDTPTPTADALAAAYGVDLPIPPCNHDTFLAALDHYAWLDRMARLTDLLAEVDATRPPYQLREVPMAPAPLMGWVADCRLCSFVTQPHSRKPTVVSRAQRHATAEHGWTREVGRG